MTEPDREWIIQRCINAFRDEYENWPGYCEQLLNATSAGRITLFVSTTS